MHVDHKYYPATIDQKLGYLVEEAGEVTTEIGKILAAVGKTQRWGLEGYNPDLGPDSETNREWILRMLPCLEREISDLENACAILRQALVSAP